MTAQRQQLHHHCGGVAMLACAAVLAVALVSAAMAATTERVVSHRLTGLALSGFDPVGYFSAAQPQLGLADFELAERGVVWRFRNAGNREAFAADPDIYAPRFGGYDPVGVARGVPVPGLASLWLIVDRRLYLFSDLAGRDAFAADPQFWLRKAEGCWPALVETLAE